MFFLAPAYEFTFGRKGSFFFVSIKRQDGVGEPREFQDMDFSHVERFATNFVRGYLGIRSEENVEDVVKKTEGRK